MHCHDPALLLGWVAAAGMQCWQAPRAPQARQQQQQQRGSSADDQRSAPGILQPPHVGPHCNASSSCVLQMALGKEQQARKQAQAKLKLKQAGRKNKNRRKGAGKAKRAAAPGRQKPSRQSAGCVGLGLKGPIAKFAQKLGKGTGVKQ